LIVGAPRFDVQQNTSTSVYGMLDNAVSIPPAANIDRACSLSPSGTTSGAITSASMSRVARRLNANWLPV
jgi:hypothetical protein